MIYLFTEHPKHIPGFSISDKKLLWNNKKKNQTFQHDKKLNISDIWFGLSDLYQHGIKKWIGQKPVASDSNLFSQTSRYTKGKLCTSICHVSPEILPGCSWRRHDHRCRTQMLNVKAKKNGSQWRGLPHHPHHTALKAPDISPQTEGASGGGTTVKALMRQKRCLRWKGRPCAHWESVTPLGSGGLT